MNADIFQINLFDWFAIWGAILIALLLLLWFARDPKAERTSRDRGFDQGKVSRRGLHKENCTHGCL